MSPKNRDIVAETGNIVAKNTICCRFRRQCRRFWRQCRRFWRHCRWCGRGFRWAVSAVIWWRSRSPVYHTDRRICVQHGGHKSLRRAGRSVSGSGDLWEISDNIPETVQDRDIVTMKDFCCVRVFQFYYACRFAIILLTFTRQAKKLLWRRHNGYTTEEIRKRCFGKWRTVAYRHKIYSKTFARYWVAKRNAERQMFAILLLVRMLT